MIYRALPTHLHATADAAIRFFRRQHGITQVRIEAEVDSNIGFRPTVIANMQDRGVLCIEVTDGAYIDALDAFVVDCERQGLPAKLFIAIPRGAELADFRTMLKRARTRGVGVVEVDHRGGQILAPALALSLTALRPVDTSRFPTKYRQALVDAQDTFLNGDPVKGCERVYDEIEDLTRVIGEHVDHAGLWRPLRAGEERSRLRFRSAPWHKVAELLRDYLDYSRVPRRRPRLDGPLLAKVIGLIPHRNQSAHKVRTRAERMARDRELRTRFEHAVDTLEELAAAARSLGV